MKQTIRIKESQLTQVIREAVEKVLNEYEHNPEIDSLKKMSRTYKYHDYDPNKMKKTFNRGMGSLEFIQMIPDEHVLLVNEILAKPRDMERIRQCFPDWKLETVSLGYPDYYFHGLSGMRNKQQ